jgi:hypothetical protein
MQFDSNFLCGKEQEFAKTGLEHKLEKPAKKGGIRAFSRTCLPIQARHLGAIVWPTATNELIEPQVLEVILTCQMKRHSFLSGYEFLRGNDCPEPVLATRRVSYVTYTWVGQLRCKWRLPLPHLSQRAKRIRKYSSSRTPRGGVLIGLHAFHMRKVRITTI